MPRRGTPMSFGELSCDGSSSTTLEHRTANNQPTVRPSSRSNNQSRLPSSNNQSRLPSSNHQSRPPSSRGNGKLLNARSNNNSTFQCIPEEATNNSFTPLAGMKEEVFSLDKSHSSTYSSNSRATTNFSLLVPAIKYTTQRDGEVSGNLLKSPRRTGLQLTRTMSTDEGFAVLCGRGGGSKSNNQLLTASNFNKQSFLPAITATEGDLMSPRGGGVSSSQHLSVLKLSPRDGGSSAGLQVSPRWSCNDKLSPRWGCKDGKESLMVDSWVTSQNKDKLQRGFAF